MQSKACAASIWQIAGTSWHGAHPRRSLHMSVSRQALTTEREKKRKNFLKPLYPPFHITIWFNQVCLHLRMYSLGFRIRTLLCIETYSDFSGTVHQSGYNTPYILSFPEIKFAHLERPQCLCCCDWCTASIQWIVHPSKSWIFQGRISRQDSSS